MKTPDDVRHHLAGLGIDLPLVDAVASAPDSALAQPLDLGDGLAAAGNRFAVLPMEGWDGTADGLPTDLVVRRWERFGRSGAKLIWGGEAVAVRHDGRANPSQLMITSDEHADALGALRSRLIDAHATDHGQTDDLVVGLQLTHSGRFARPDDDGPRPLIAYHHPLLDERITEGTPNRVLSDGELDSLAENFVAAAVRAQTAGFDFVDIKACHGYLGHELLSAVDRPGLYGGDLAGRTRFLRSVIAGIRSAVPDLAVAVRLSVFDVVPFRTSPDGIGVPEPTPDGLRYRHAFGGDGTGTGVDLDETIELLDLLAELGVRLICVTAGSPYYSPHVQRPAYFPPSDGYAPPEDPLVGVARLIDAAAEIKRRRPSTVVIGSGYSYLQEWLPNVAEAVVAAGGADAIGIGRMVLSYPTLPADVLAGHRLDRRHLCRTFSDCTTAPRAGLVSGCYPLDEAYKSRPERSVLVAVKREARAVLDPPIVDVRTEGNSTSVGGRWTYHWGASRRPYVHPLQTPAGHVLTRNAPDDHPWHHGLWFSIKYVDGDNFWEEMAPYGVIRHDGPPEIENGPNGRVTLRGGVRWIRPDRETVAIYEGRALTHVPIDEDTYAVDFGTVLTPTTDVVLDRTPFTTWGGYGGLTLRGPSDWHDTRLLLPDDREVDRVLGEPGAWCALVGMIGAGGAEAQAGLAVFDAPSNRRHPVPWYGSTRAATYGDEGWSNFLNAAFLFHEPLSLPAGDELRLDHRVVVHDGNWSHDHLAELYAEWVDELA